MVPRTFEHYLLPMSRLQFLMLHFRTAQWSFSQQVLDWQTPAPVVWRCRLRSTPRCCNWRYPQSAIPCSLSFVPAIATSRTWPWTKFVRSTLTARAIRLSVWSSPIFSNWRAQPNPSQTNETFPSACVTNSWKAWTNVSSRGFKGSSTSIALSSL